MAIPQSHLLPGRRVSPQEREDHKRKLLLAAAWQVVEEKGWHSASMEEIAERAGYSRRPIYTAFGSKEGLALAMFLQTVDRNAGRIIEGLDLSGTTEDVAGSIARLSAANTQLPEYRVQYQLHAVASPVLLRDEALRAAYIATIRNAVNGVAAVLTDVAQREGQRFTIDIAELSRHLTAMLTGMNLLALDSTPTLGVVDADEAERACRALVRGFLA